MNNNDLFNGSSRNNLWIVFTILIILSIFIPTNSAWYFPVNLVLLLVLYGLYYFFIRSGQFGWAIFEGAISAIWFDSSFKSPFGSSQAISMFFGIVGLILMVIAIILDIRSHRENR